MRSSLVAAGSGALLVAGVLQALPAAAAYTAPGAMTGAGARPGATRLSFAAGDHVAAQVDVGTGNLLVTTSDLSLPGVSSDVGLGMAYNSLSIGTGAPQDSTASAAGYGWTQLVGWGVVLVPQTGGSVIYQGPGGLTGTFTPVSGSTTAFTAPGGLKADLVKTTSGYTLTDHDSGQVSTFTTAGVLATVADRNGNATTIATSSGLPTSITSSRGPSGARTAAVTTTGGQITKVTQTSGTSTRSVSYGYTSGDLTSITDAAGRATTFTYTGHQLSEIRAPGAVDTRFTYDTSHRVKTVTQVNATTGSPGDAVTSLTYNTASTLVYEPNQGPVGAADTYTLTSDGTKRVASVTDAAGRTQSTTYNANFDALTSAQGAGTTASKSSNTYGANSGESLTASTAPGGASSGLGYASTAASTKYLATSATDDAGNASLFTYNGTGNQLTAADAAGNKATLTYNADGTVATAAAPGNGTNATTYTYDTGHNLTGVTPVTGSTLTAQTFTWDAYGRLATATDGRGIITTYTYDADDRVVRIDHQTAIDTTFTYTSAGQVATRTDDDGTVTYTYDAQNRLTSTVNTFDNVKTSYGYDRSSNLASKTDASGTTTYSYDAGNALTSMVGARKFSFAVDDHGRRTDTWMGGDGPTATNWAVHSRTSYDTTGRVTGVIGEKKPATTAPSGATKVVDLSSCYATGSTAPSCSTSTTADRSLVQWTRDNLTGQVTTYTYDQANRLSGASVTAGTDASGAALPATSYAYAYDARGNRTSATTTGATSTTQTRSYNPANQTTSTGFTYDAAGNLTADPAVGTMTYTNSGHMSNVTTGGVTYHYDYAGEGQEELISEQTPNGTYGYTYGRTNALGQPIIEAATWSHYTGASAYLYNDEDGSPVGITTSAGGQAMYIYDGQGSPVALIGDGNNTAFTTGFDPYGVATTTYASGGQAINESPYTYTRGLNDRTTGWIKDGARYYSPTEGRWTQQDALNAPLDPGNANRYMYAADNPVNYLDPAGLSVSRSCGIALGGEAFAVAGVGLVIVTVGTGGTAGAIFVAGAVLAGGSATVAVAGLYDSCPTGRRHHAR